MKLLYKELQDRMNMLQERAEKFESEGKSIKDTESRLAELGNIIVRVQQILLVNIKKK